MPEPPSIQPSLARIDRADENIIELHLKCREFVDGRPYEFICNSDSETHIHTFMVTQVSDTPLPIRVRVGEIAHHLRASFDLLVYQLMLKAGVTDEKRLTECAFPVIIDCDRSDEKGREKYDSIMRRKIHGIPPSALTRIEALQPCNTLGADRSFLSQIDRLDNTDKHRLLLSTVAGVNIGNARWNDGKEPPVTVASGTHIPLNAGAVIKIGPTNPEVEVDLNRLPLRIEVTISEPGSVWLKPVVPTLQNFSNIARRTIETFGEDFR